MHHNGFACVYLFPDLHFVAKSSAHIKNYYEREHCKNLTAICNKAAVEDSAWYSTESSLKRPRKEIFLSGRKSFAFAEQLDCFTFIAILRHGANHASSLMFVPGDLRINVCSISGKPAHALCLTNIPCPYCFHCLI